MLAPLAPLVAAGLSVSAAAATQVNSAQSDPMSRVAAVELVDVPLEEALQRIQHVTGLRFVYSPDLVPVDRRVACPCADKTVKEALDLIFQGTGLTFRASGSQVRILPVRRPPAESQAGTIAGTVTSASPDIPVPNAFVQLEGDRGSFTDRSGSFVISDVHPGTYALTVTALGWDSTEVRGVQVVAGDTATVRVRLRPRVIPLSEIVVAPGTYGIFKGLVQEQSLTREEVETLPHLGEDIFRAADHVPGVTTYDATARLYIRGSRAEEVLTMLDGLELYEPYHLKNWDGVLSIVDLESVAEVDLITGGFPAEYGDKGTGVFVMRTTNAQPGRTVTSLGLSFGGASFKSEGSFSEGRGTWLASARRGYLDILLALMGNDDDLSPTYYDAFGKVRYQINPDHLVSAHILHAGDDVTGEEEDFTRFHHKFGSSYAWLSWDGIFASDLSARTVLSVGRVSRDRVGGDYEDEGGTKLLDVHDRGTFDFIGLKQDWTLELSAKVLLKAGFDLKQGWADYDYSRWRMGWQPNTIDPFAPAWTAWRDTLTVRTRPTGQELGVYVADRFQIADPLVAEIGVRYDRQSQTGGHFSPRVNLALEVLPRTVLRGAWGHYYQSHGLHELNAADGDLRFYPAQRAEHRALGLEHRLANGALLRVEAYRRSTTNPIPEYRNLVPRVEGLDEEGPGDRVFIQPDRREARGVEVYAKGAPGATFAWSGSYALAVAEEEISGEWFPRPHDQRHSITVQVAYRPNPRWSMSSGWLFHSGWPYTEESYGLADLAPGGVYMTRTFGPMNRERLIPYHRLDARVSRRFRLRRGQLFVYLDVFNLYGRHNPEAVSYFAAFDPTRNELTVFRSIYDQLEMLPTFGVRWEF